MGSDFALELRGLTVSYDEDPVLVDVDLQVDVGRLVGIVGPNGAGKSTLIKAILGLVPADGGVVRVLGGELSKRLKQLVYVPQRNSVDWDFPVTVRDVVTMGRYARVSWWGRLGREHRAAVDRALDQVGLMDYANRHIANLSGGQQQRTFLARALAQGGDLYFMDEPFVGVDAATESAIVDTLKQLRDDGKTVIVVNHDLTTAKAYFDDLVLLNKTVKHFGPIEDVFTPANLQDTYGGKLTFFGEKEGAFVA